MAIALVGRVLYGYYLLCNSFYNRCNNIWGFSMDKIIVTQRLPNRKFAALAILSPRLLTISQTPRTLSEVARKI